MNPAAILSLISELYQTTAELRAENEQLRQALAEARQSHNVEPSS